MRAGLGTPSTKVIVPSREREVERAHFGENGDGFLREVRESTRELGGLFLDGVDGGRGHVFSARGGFCRRR